MEDNIKYKQEAISRMSDFQMRIKSLSVAITTGSIFVNMDNCIQNILVVVILLSLWVLDSYYLSIERKIRNTVKDFGFRKIRDKETIFNNLFKKSVCIFHLTFVIISIISVIMSMT